MTTIESAATTAGVGDVGELYGRLARRLEQIVRLDVRAPDVVIEDACQFAWSRLLHHRDRVHRETALTWLSRTAVHEAFKLLRRDGRELSLQDAADQPTAPVLGCDVTPVEWFERHERLAELHHLPERQQRVLWLHAFGLSYSEIAEHEQCTVRTVDRQLLRARKGLARGNGV